MATTTITWPPTLAHRKLVTADIAGSLPDVMLRTDIEAGPAKVRGRYLAAVEPVSGSVVITHDELQVLRDWFFNDIAGGAAAWLWAHPMTGEQREFRFVEPPKYQPLAPRIGGRGMVRVQLSLEILPAVEVAGISPGVDAVLLVPMGGDPGEGWADFGVSDERSGDLGPEHMPPEDSVADPDMWFPAELPGFAPVVDSEEESGTMQRSTAFGLLPFAPA